MGFLIFLIFNLFMIFATAGWWLLLLLFWVLYKITRK